MPYKNPETKRLKDKEYREKNKERLKKYHKCRYEEKKDDILKSKREYYSRTREHHLEKMREYNRLHKAERKERDVANKKHIQEYDRTYYKQRINSDVNYKIRRNLRSRIAKALRGIGEKSEKTTDLLGCTVEEFKAYIESQFKDGMSWENYGHSVWHLDHKIPCSFFDLTDAEQQKKCFNYTNIRPLWASDNLSKGNKLNILLKGVLEYSYSTEECAREYKLLQTKTGDFSSKQHLNKIVLTNQPHFYEEENRLWKENKDNVRQFIVDNRIRYIGKDEYHLTDKEALRAFKISGKYFGFTHFNPLWIRAFIEKYNIKTMYDPCGGWGHRLLGASKIDLYIYNDLDFRTVEGCKNIATTHGITNTVFYNNDCRSFKPLETYECVFTCPPYYNLEIYNDTKYKNLDDYKQFWYNTVNSSLKDSVKYFAYVINDTYYDILKEVCSNVGLVHQEDISLGTYVNHFNKENTTKSEKLVVWASYNMGKGSKYA